MKDRMILGMDDICRWMDHLQFLLREQSSLRCPPAVAMLFPRTSDEYCHSDTPANQPNSSQALETASPTTEASTHPPLVASEGITGLPTTSFFWSTPNLTSSATAVPGRVGGASMKISEQLAYLVPWLKNCRLQKLSVLLMSVLRERQLPRGYRWGLKQPASGEWVTVWFGSSFRKWEWKLDSHFQPEPDSRASESCQLTSQPSRELSRTKEARPLAQSCQSSPNEVGFSCGPKALTSSCTFPSAYFFFRFSWISLLVFPKMESSPKYSNGLLHTSAASDGTSPHFQKPSERQLQIFSSEQPGTPRLEARRSTGCHSKMRSMQPKRTGQLVLAMAVRGGVWDQIWKLSPGVIRKRLRTMMKLPRKNEGPVE